jgi:hypothetical protein
MEVLELRQAPQKVPLGLGILSIKQSRMGRTGDMLAHYAIRINNTNEAFKTRDLCLELGHMFTRAPDKSLEVDRQSETVVSKETEALFYLTVYVSIINQAIIQRPG